MRNLYNRKMEEEGGAPAGGGWKDNIPSELHDAPFFKEADSVTAALEEINNAAAYMGNSIRIPGEDAGKEDLETFHAKLAQKVPGLMPTPDFESDNARRDMFRRLGAPDAIENYKLPDGVEPDDPFIQVAFENNLTQSQFDEIMASTLKTNNQLIEERRLEQNRNLLKLKKDWGLAFDDRHGRVSALLEIMEAPDHIAKAFKNNNLDTSLVRWLDKVADSLGAEANNFDEEGETKIGMTPAEAEAKIAEINGNNQHPYWNPQDPGHAQAKIKMEELMKARVASRG